MTKLLAVLLAGITGLLVALVLAVYYIGTTILEALSRG